MSQKNPEHIINYILRKTEIDPKIEVWKYYEKRNKRYTIDQSLFFCRICNNVWNKVPKWINPVRWRYFPKGNLPTLGKKRKKCPNCTKFIKNDKKRTKDQK